MRHLTARLLLLSLGLGAFVLLTAPRSARAYPQWQFSSGTTRCNQCHFSPSGGGLLNRFGRDAAGEELSTWEGDGGFLHGAVELPDWLALGAELRGASMYHDVGDPEGPKQVFFPMQADVYARLGLGSVSVVASAGYRGQIRQGRDPVGGDNYMPAAADRFISREHYVMWRSGALGPYVRAGRFMVPFGLRLAEHSAYVRRDLSYNVLQENYGASFGVVQNGWELHLTGYARDFVRHMGSQESGGAGLFELRVGDNAAVGLSARAGFHDGGGQRLLGGPIGKLYLEKVKTLLMLELNAVNAKGERGPSSTGAVGLFGATVFPARGVWVSLYGEHSQTDVGLRTTATEGANLQLQWFPFPHFELLWLGRLQFPNGQESAKTFMLMLHYYL